MNAVFRRALGFLATDTLMIGVLKLMARGPRSRSLVLVRTDNIGDFILWLDCAAALRACYREYRIVLVANRTVEDLARALPLWDQVIAVDMPRLSRSRRYRWRVFRQLAELRAELALQPVFSRVLLGGDALIRSTAAATRIGYLGDCTNMGPREQRLGNRWYTRLIPATPGTVMEYARNAEFLAGAGIPSQATSALRVTLAAAAATPGAPLPAEPFFLVFIGGSTTRRRWAVENYARVADEVHRRFRWTAVIVGGEDSTNDGRRLKELIGSHPALDLTGTTDLPGLIALIARGNFLVGNESSAIHLAAALGIRSVCVLGGGEPGRFLPYPDHFPGVRPVVVSEPMTCFGCNWQCVLSRDPDRTWPCIAAVSVEQVLSGIERALASGEPSSAVQVAGLGA